jgi:4'-phosphopantetheinyl transferase
MPLHFQNFSLDSRYPFDRPDLQANEVHLWRFDPETVDDLSHYLALLSSDEKDRAARFRFQHLADSFIADHGRLRLVLGAYTQSNPVDLVFVTNEYGKPRLASPGSSICFNLSHTTGLTVLAVCLNAELGIDVEAVRPMDELEAVAASHFSKLENAALHETTEPDRQHAFFRCWTRKEAFIKAKGQGLSLPLDTFSVSLAPGPASALLHCAWDADEAAQWSLISLPLGPQFAGALAIRHHGWNIHWVTGPQSLE